MYNYQFSLPNPFEALSDGLFMSKTRLDSSSFTHLPTSSSDSFPAQPKHDGAPPHFETLAESMASLSYWPETPFPFSAPGPVAPLG